MTELSSAKFSGARRSDQFQTELPADGGSGSLKGVQGDAGIGWIEQAVKRSAAGLHPDRHGGLGDAVPLHSGFDLIGEDLLYGLFLALFQDALLGQEAVK